jgi:Ca2+-transporting ATPase
MMVIANSLTLLFLALIVYINPIAVSLMFFFQLHQIAICAGVVAVSVLC